MKALISIAILAWLSACGQPQSESELPPSNSSTVDPAATTSAPPAQEVGDQRFKIPGDYAGSHILIGFEGAERVAETVTRTKEEALEKAKQLLDRLLQEPGLFEDLASMESDGPSAEAGGDLGVWRKGAMVEPFEQALVTLEIGKIYPEPVETRFGYHLIRRNPIKKVIHYGARAFFICFKGHPNVPPEVTRTKEEAQTLAAGLTVNVENFEEMARQHNDFGPQAVFLGAFKEGDGVPPELLATMRELGIGGVTGPMEFPMGYAYIQRVELRQYAGSHILIAYQGAKESKPDLARTKAEAEGVARDLIEKLNQDPSQFSILARLHSDGPSAPRGGDLGVWFKGNMIPEFDEAIETLAVGGITQDPVETPYGFHIIQRRAP